MKAIDVRQQPRLSIARTFEICTNGVRFRLFRSSVTVVVIAVAIAFLMNILCEAIGVAAIRREAQTRTQDQRLSAFWSARLTVADSPEALIHELAALSEDSALLHEDQRMGGIVDADMPGMRAMARRADRYLGFFGQLNHGTQRMLYRNASGVAVFDRLTDSAHMADFQAALDKMPTLHLPEGRDGLHSFTAAWPAFRAQTDAILRGRETARGGVARALDGASLDERLADVEGAFGDAVLTAGFVGLDGATRGVVAAQARDARASRLLEAGLSTPQVRSGLAARLGKLPGDMNKPALWAFLRRESQAAWYLSALGDARLETGGVTARQAVGLAQTRAEQAGLDAALRATGAQESGQGAKRIVWLVIISLIVCAVGISNAMLMSVTERFREIATLKCLGALDGFIMLLFVMEAGMLGIVGGLMGALAGSIIGVGRLAAGFGGLAFEAFPYGQWALAALGAVAVGMVLSALAGVYPSHVAARLAPMEAMRIE